MPELHIASAVLRARPASVAPLAARILQDTLVEVVAASEEGKLVLVFEGDSTGSLLDQMDAIRAFEGVLSIELVYQHAEDTQDMEETLS